MGGDTMNVTAGGDTSVIAMTSVLYLEVHAGGQAGVAIWADAGALTVSGEAGVNLLVKDSLNVAHVNSAGPVSVAVGGDVNQLNVETTWPYASIAAGGDLNDIHVQTGASLDLTTSITALGDVSGLVQGGNINVTAGGDVLAGISGVDITIVAHGDVTGGVYALGDLAVQSWGDVIMGPSQVIAAEGYLTIKAAGDVVSDYSDPEVLGRYVGHNVTVNANGAIDAHITGDHVLEVAARGNIAGVIASPLDDVNHITSGGSVSATVDVSVPHAPPVENAAGLFGDYESEPHFGMEQLEAGIAGAYLQMLQLVHDLSSAAESLADQNVIGQEAAVESTQEMAAQKNEALLQAAAAMAAGAWASQSAFETSQNIAQVSAKSSGGSFEASMAGLAAYVARQLLKENQAVADNASDLLVRQRRMESLEAGKQLASASLAAEKAKSRIVEKNANAKAAEGREARWFEKSRKVRAQMLESIKAYENQYSARTILLQAVTDVIQSATSFDSSGVLSMIIMAVITPVFSAIGNLVDGNIMDAAMDLVSCLPVGRIAGALGQIGKLAVNLCKARKWIGTAISLYQAGRAAANGDYLGAAGFLGMAALSWFTGGCFAAGTQVVVGIDPNDPSKFITKNIEDIKVGDMVLSKNQDDPNAPLEYKPVTEVFSQTVNNLRILDIQNQDGSIEEFRTTDQHPFFVEGKGWIEAGELETGDKVLTPSGQTATIANTRFETHPEGLTVYNFEVDGPHTYFVLDGQGLESTPIWVHNAKSSTSGCSSQARAGIAKHIALTAATNAKGSAWTTISKILPSGKRMDAVKVKFDEFGKIIKILVLELKPNNKRAIAKGIKQVAGYVAELRSMPEFSGAKILSRVIKY